MNKFLILGRLSRILSFLTTQFYQISGEISDRFVALNFRISEQKQIGIVSGLFEVVSDGSTMLGCIVGYETSRHQVEPKEAKLIRISTDLCPKTDKKPVEPEARAYPENARRFG